MRVICQRRGMSQYATKNDRRRTRGTPACGRTVRAAARGASGSTPSRIEDRLAPRSGSRCSRPVASTFPAVLGCAATSRDGRSLRAGTIAAAGKAGQCRVGSGRTAGISRLGYRHHPTYESQQGVTWGTRLLAGEEPMSEAWDYKKAGLDLDEVRADDRGHSAAPRADAGPHARDPAAVPAAEGRQGRRRVRQPLRPRPAAAQVQEPGARHLHRRRRQQAQDRRA